MGNKRNGMGFLLFIVCILTGVGEVTVQIIRSGFFLPWDPIQLFALMIDISNGIPSTLFSAQCNSLKYLLPSVLRVVALRAWQ